MKLIKYKCGECNTIFIADSKPYHLNYCPGCGNTIVDLEEYYCRLIGNVKLIEEYNPDWIDNEKEYYTATLQWLNDSDEKYKIIKKDGKTRILKVERKQ